MTTPSAFSTYLFSLQFGPAVLESVPVLGIDLHDPTMTIVYASTLLEEMFGYDKGELIGKPLDVLLRPEDVEAHHAHFEEFSAAPSTRPMNAGVHVDAVKKDGSPLKVQVSLAVQPVGQTDCAIAFMADVTWASQS